MTEDELYNKIVSWTKLYSELPIVIRDSLGKPRPATPYGMVNLIGKRRVNLPESIDYEDNSLPDGKPFREIPVIKWQTTFSFNVYGPGASDYAHRVETAGSRAFSTEALKPLVLFGTGDIRRIPELVNQLRENRVQMDIITHHLARDGISVHVIETLPTEVKRK